MHRQPLINILKLYNQVWVPGKIPFRSYNRNEEENIYRAFDEFLAAEEACFERHSERGHFTGSALVTDPRGEKVLLTHHAKLHLWLQLGGHADGDPDLHAVARRETEEEAGLKEYITLPYEPRVLDPQCLAQWQVSGRALPFDLDFHHIPARRAEPEHIHYDVRYLLVADPALPLIVTAESKDLRWLSLEEARLLTDERSMHRQFDKLEALRGIFR